MKVAPHIQRVSVLGLLFVLAACHNPYKRELQPFERFGFIRRQDPRMDLIVPPGTQVEKLAGGFEWSEGPVWDRDAEVLYFSDVPRNTIYVWWEKWGDKGKLDVYLKPSGYTGDVVRAGEPGSNGLTLDGEGRLVICEHGDRRVSRLEDRKRGIKTTLASQYQGKRLNSPNDCVYSSRGDLYFTDPPYGLDKQNADPAKELDFNGVYRLSSKGELTLLTKELTFPNGIALSPDEKTLYVANSDPEKAVWMAFAFEPNGLLGPGRVLFDATPLVKEGRPGLPDGLKVDQQGFLFATGPGGVLVLAPDGKHIGTIETGEAIANCGWGDDGSTLYLTSDMFLCRIKLKAKGLGF